MPRPLASPEGNGLGEVQSRVAEEAYRPEARGAFILAHNPGQGLVSKVSALGWTITPQLTDTVREATSKLDRKASDYDRKRLELVNQQGRPDWSLSFRFDGLGRLDPSTGEFRATGKRRGALRGASPVTSPVIGPCDGTGRKGALGRCFGRVELRREGIKEYLVNEPRGVEHGYFVAERPGGEGALAVSTRFSGLKARVVDGGQAVVFGDGPKDRLRYVALLVKDASGRRLPASMAVVDDQLLIQVDDRGAAYPVHIDPLATTPTPVLDGEASGSRFGNRVAPAGDVNGDGFADVIVGAYTHDGNMGKAYVFLGSQAGILTTAAWTAVGDGPGRYFGYSVASAGDVNGDGFADVIVGAVGSAGGVGQAHLFLGSPTGPSPTADWSAFAEGTNNYFGDSVASAGDVNGDGFADVLVGAYGYASESGRAYLYLGSTAGLLPTPAWIATGEAAWGRFGHCVATAGDVNGDGFADIMVSALLFNSGHGRAYLFLGSPAGPSALPAWTVDGDAPGDHLGHAAISAGDVNGDGYADVVVGSHNHDSSRGQAFLFLGSAAGLAATPAWTTTGEADNNYYGYDIASAGDVNGDGFADVIVGAFGNDSNRGRAYLYLGSAVGLAPTPAWTASGDLAGGSFGQSVASAGDVNGDGFADVIVSTPNYNSATGRA
ncbi:MAG: FG-GAP-like repeat-containing protein, partial [Polyangia bacterium]|nr:FG-GAP-like repeat-containing protein [Polyangia bacterium]